jgi:predicted nuclease of predicted toxin-antitoxin system
MRILADENCDRMVVVALRKAGHDVSYVVEGRRGEPDRDLFTAAREQNRILLTDDLDFGRIAELALQHPPAIILARLYPMDRAVYTRRIIEALTSLGDSVLGHLVVIEPSQVRMRSFSDL